MELLLVAGSYGLFALFTIASGVISGLGLAAGFELFRTIKSKMSKFFSEKKNEEYIKNLEDKMVAGQAVVA